MQTIDIAIVGGLIYVIAAGSGRLHSMTTTLPRVRAKNEHAATTANATTISVRNGSYG
jgi:hypothetical protein